jgi:hypothetical protein
VSGKAGRIGAAAIATALVVSATAVAATPVKGGSYRGKFNGGAKELRVRVASSGRRVTARLYCTNEHVGTLSLPVVHGAFKGSKSSGGTLLWSVKGRFSTRTTIDAGVHIKALCDGRSGKAHLTLVP